MNIRDSWFIPAFAPRRPVSLVVRVFFFSLFRSDGWVWIEATHDYFPVFNPKGLDGRHTVFGKVLEGEDVIKRVEEQGTNSGKPQNKVTVTESGEIS